MRPRCSPVTSGSGGLSTLTYREVAREIAVADLRVAAALDLGDWFRFEIGLRGRSWIPMVSAFP